MGKSLIYLDWNAFKSWKNSQTEFSDGMNRLFSNYANFIIIPYSSAHLADLNKDYKDNQELIEQDLNFLKSKTNDIIIAKYGGRQETVLEHRDILEFFHEIEEQDSSSESDLKPLTMAYENAISQIDLLLSKINLSSILPSEEELLKTESGQRFIKQFPQFIKSRNFASLVNDISNHPRFFQQNPKEFNELRKGIANDLKLDSNISNWENSISKLDEFLPNTLIGKSFTEILHETVHRYHKDPIYYDYYGAAYHQLGLFGFRPDKLSEKNRYLNSIDDGNHSYYGSICNCFITNEKTIYYRSKALFEAFGVKSTLYGLFSDVYNSDMFGELEDMIKMNCG